MCQTLRGRNGWLRLAILLFPGIVAGKNLRCRDHENRIDHIA